MLICQTAVYESGFLDDRQAADLFRFPLCVRALKARPRRRAVMSGSRGALDDTCHAARGHPGPGEMLRTSEEF